MLEVEAQQNLADPHFWLRLAGAGVVQIEVQ